MSEEEKKNVDIIGLSAFMRNGLISIGLLNIIGYYLFKWCGFLLIANLMPFIVGIVGVTILVINAQKFHNENILKSKQINVIIYLVLGFVFLCGVALTIYGIRSPKVIISKQFVQFSGMYGVHIKISEIDNIELVDTLPEIQTQTSGFSLGTVKNGFFDIKTFGTSRLIIQSENPPYLIISKGNAPKIIINFKEKSETESAYIKIKTLIENK
ncbi:protein of unknown function [Flexibacter flexilis DSM 6793]|uniref:PH domain-containing protein n=2 Tax=Flexibacter flexilis TaxID=998 RepID=A0A1I1NW80_9BACT|nr:protein of unknown function [Flexibacter flexilis DSM 6793]